MSNKRIVRIVLTGGPAAGKTSLVSRILKEFKAEDGWKVITIPETATELISGFGLGPFPGCMDMETFQYFVVDDQLHKEQLALKGAETVPEEKVMIIYDRAVFDDLAYITEEQFVKTLACFGKTPAEVMAGYDAVLHLVTCAKGAEFAYNYGNAARYEDISVAREKDDLTLQAWSTHPNVRVTLVTGPHEDIFQRVVAGQLDLVVNDQRRALAGHFVNLELGDQPLYALLRQDDPLARRGGITLDELKDRLCVIVAPQGHRDAETVYWRDVMNFAGDLLFVDSAVDAALNAVAGVGWMPCDRDQEVGPGMALAPLMRGGEPVLRKMFAFWLEANDSSLQWEFSETLSRHFE